MYFVRDTLRVILIFMFLLPSNISFAAEFNKPKIERLVMSSGSAKGSAYPGVYKALIDLGVLADVDHLTGSSAGSIIGALMAIGIDFSEMYNDFRSTDFTSLIGNWSGSLFSSRLGVSVLTFDAQPIEAKIRKLINDSIRAFFQSSEGSQICETYQNIAKIGQRFFNESSPQFTFEDLYYLHQALPERFKNVTMLAVELPSGDPHIFNYQLTPDFEIALACRASSGIPVAFEPVVTTISNRSVVLIDGGIFDLLPSEYFDLSSTGFLPNQKPAQTLLFAFADHPNVKESAPYRAIKTKISPIYQPPWHEKKIRDLGPWLFGSFKAAYTNSEQWEKSYQRMRSLYSNNTIIIGVGEVHQVQFQKAEILAKEMSAVAYVDTLFSIIPHFHFSSNFDSEKYFNQFNAVFMRIFRALAHTDKDLALLNELSLLEISNQEMHHMRFCQIVREHLRNKLHEPRALAFARAWEYTQGLVSEEQLEKEFLHE